MSAHEQSVGKTDEWYTPAYVFEAMGARFDFDVASPDDRLVPADKWCADSIGRSSLERNWHGFIWMNPPFGKRNGLAPWLDKFFEHGNGVALTPDRTSTDWWQDAAERAHSILLVRSKIKFIKPDGSVGAQPGTGTTLFASGFKGCSALARASTNGLGFLAKKSHFASAVAA
jgi:hypothetical protein